MKRLHLPATLGLVLAAIAGIPATAQDKVTLPRAEYENLKRQAAEADRLREELNRVQADLTRLKQSSSSPLPPTKAPAPVQVTAPPAVPPTSATAASRTEQNPARPATTPPTSAASHVPAPLTLPASQPGEVLDVTDLIQHFAQNPVEAASRYSGKPIKLRGVVAAFEKPVLRREFEILFRAGAGQISCRVSPPERYTAVFTTRSGAVLTGRTDRGAEAALFTIGDVVDIAGQCVGFKDGTISITRCKVAGLK